jgi:hypothetical protein
LASARSRASFGLSAIVASFLHPERDGDSEAQDATGCNSVCAPLRAGLIADVNVGTPRSDDRVGHAAESDRTIVP